MAVPESQIPDGLVSLMAAQAKGGAEVSLMGVVVDFFPVRGTRGDDQMASFDLQDSSLKYLRPLTVRCFRKKEQDLPKIHGKGDVVLVRNMKMKNFQNEMMAISSFGSSWSVFPASSIPQNANEVESLRRTAMMSSKVTITPSQCLYAISLGNGENRPGFSDSLPRSTLTDRSSVAHVIQPAHKRVRQRADIKDVEVDNFYNLVVQVVKMFPLDGRMTLYVSDYTEHINNYNYHRDLNDLTAEILARAGDEFGYAGKPKSKTDKSWNGPWGKLTLQVTLFSPHAAYAQENVKEGDWVHIENAKIKINPRGNIEAVVHTDHIYSDKITISVLDEKDDRTKDARRRKRDYQVKLKNQEKSLFGQITGNKRKGGGVENTKRGQKKAKGGKKNTANQSDTFVYSRGESDVPVEPKNPQSLARYDVNKHVRCSHPQLAVRSLYDILNDKSLDCTTTDGLSYRLPFQNAKYRARLRVVDFFPSRLQDFAVPKPSSEFDDLSSDDGMSDNDSSDGDPETATHWRWRFALLVEDGSSAHGSTGKQQERIQVIVADEDAEYLLNMDAVNLTKNSQALSKLREQLFLLWGDLEERKVAAARSQALTPINSNGADRALSQEPNQPSTRPFECCLKEFGVQNEDANGNIVWDRRWRMFGTTI